MRRAAVFCVLLCVTLGGFALADEAAAPVEAPASAGLFSDTELEAMKSKEEKFEFQAEVTRLMDIIINSLYKDREIFLRELISNAADALDKIRFLSLTDKSVLGEGDVADLDIRIKFDKDARTLTLTDKGVGMSKEELVKNLGVVAKSGTTEFLKKAQSNNDTLSLIGQFGVGFYSVYLVADKVTVISKSNDDPTQHIWESRADSTFTVTEDPRGNTLGRGTSIVLHLKDDASEFLSEHRIEELVQKYSQFINFPIYVWSTKEVEKDVPVEEDEAKEEDEAVDLDKKEDSEEEATETEGEDGEDADKKDEAPKTKKVKEMVSEWRQLNTAKAIWTRSPREITDEEYTEFYKSLTHDHEAPLSKIHFSAEGEISFKSILYIPKKAEAGLYDRFYDKSTALKLYVRRVLITDVFDDFLPRYLNFVKGVVDSDDLPLNVNRETLAQSKVLKVMSKKITRKVLEMLKKLADGEKPVVDEESDDEEAVEDKKDEVENKDYATFWEEFGKSIKLGVIDDRSNKGRLSKLLRFQTSKSDGKFISLEDYVERMKENQKFVYYATGESVDALKSSPFMEQLTKRDLEVVFMTDALDEYLMQSLTEFDGHSFMSISKEGLKLPGDDKKKDQNKALQEEFEDFTQWLKEHYKEKVEKVVVSNRISKSPCVLVTGQYGWSANMERIMKAQAFTDAAKNPWMFSRKTMEINPRHPLIAELRKRAAEDPTNKSLGDLADLMYDAALVASGFNMEDPSVFASRIHRVMSMGLDIDPNTPVPEEEIEEEEAPVEDASADGDEADVDLDAADADEPTAQAAENDGGEEAPENKDEL